MKKLSTIIIVAFISLSAVAQQFKLITAEEISIPTDNPWGVTYHNGYFWISDVENGNIIRLHPYQEDIAKIKAPRNHITGLTFEGDYLWVLSDEWDTIAFPQLCSQKALLFKLDPVSGDVLDTLLVPYYFGPYPLDSLIMSNMIDPFIYARYLTGISYFDSSLFVSYQGGWGPSLFRVEMNNHIMNLCCAHPSGMETVKGELWAVRDYPWYFMDTNTVYPDVTDPSTGSSIGDGPIPVFNNAITPVIIKDSSAYEDWERQLEFDFYASDLAWDGFNFWLCDPWEKKLKRMVIDTIPPDTILHCFSIDKLEIIPRNPTVADDIKVVCQSTFTSGGCNMVNYDLKIGKTGIFIQANHEVGMLTYICSSTDTINIGKLPSGHRYLLEYSLTAINLNCGVVTDYLDFFVRDTAYSPVYLEIIPEHPVAGEEVKVVTHGICYLNAEFNISERHITLYAYANSCSMSPCGIDTISLGFLTPEAYSLEYYLMDICSPDPSDSLWYYEEIDFDVKGATGIEETETGLFSIYPNPAHERLIIQSLQAADKLILELFNLNGQRVINTTYQDQTEINLNLSGLKSGMYFLKLTTEKGISSKKIIIY